MLCVGGDKTLLDTSEMSFTLQPSMFLPPQCHHMSLMDFVVSPLGCGQSVTDF
jgi:hypothetical protein